MERKFKEGQKVIAVGQDENGEKVSAVVFFHGYLEDHDQEKLPLNDNQYVMLDCLIKVNDEIQNAHSSCLHYIH